MGVPLVAGDQGGPYAPPSPTLPPVIAVVQVGSVRVFVKGKSVALANSTTVTTFGTIITSTINSLRVLVEGAPVILGGSLTNLSSGYSNGTVFAIGAIGVLMN